MRSGELPDYWIFAVLVFLNGLGGGIFTAPNTAAIMSSVPAEQRGAASGVRSTFFNGGNSLSIGIFFSLMIVGLAHTLPTAMSNGLTAQRDSGQCGLDIANLPPVGSLFAAFLGYNPIAELLAPSGALHMPGVNADVLTGQTFFPELITEPFHSGLTSWCSRGGGDDADRRAGLAVQSGRYGTEPGADNASPKAQYTSPGRNAVPRQGL